MLRNFPVFLVFWGLFSWKGVAFCQMLFWVYWDDHMISVLFNMVMSDSLLYVEPTLHSWDKSLLVKAWDAFYILLHSVCLHFEDFCIYFHKRYWSIVSFSYEVFGCSIRVTQSYNIGYTEWVEVFSPFVFWKNLWNTKVNSSLRIW